MPPGTSTSPSCTGALNLRWTSGAVNVEWLGRGSNRVSTVASEEHTEPNGEQPILRAVLLLSRSMTIAPVPCLPQPQRSSASERRQVAPPRAVESAQRRLSKHFSVARPVEAMLKRSKLAERTFKRRFVSAAGLAPIAYVQRLRIEDAKKRLERTDAPVDEVSWRVGYEDPARDLHGPPVTPHTRAVT